jgi:hypothetical protein
MRNHECTHKEKGLCKKSADNDEDLLYVRLDSGRTAREELKALRTLARLLASRFKVLGVKFGADALVGLVPVAGDAVTCLTGGGCHAGSITILYVDRAP